jgi:hypothetical protein
MTRIRTPPPAGLSQISQQWQSPTSKLAERVLRVAGRLYQPGQVASPMEISKEVGCSRQTISGVITMLRRRNLWPYKGGRIGIKYNRSDAR